MTKRIQENGLMSIIPSVELRWLRRLHETKRENKREKKEENRSPEASGFTANGPMKEFVSGRLGIRKSTEVRA